MKTPKIPQVNLPYTSTVASFFGDQGAAQGNSFLGKLFKGSGGRNIVSQAQASVAKPVATPLANPITGKVLQ